MNPDEPVVPEPDAPVQSPIDPVEDPPQAGDAESFHLAPPRRRT
jgi:hypothetical protein